MRGPFTVLLHAPELTARLERVGHYLRYESNLPDRARELAIMIVAQRHRCDTEWTSHLKFALASGIDQRDLDAIAAGEEPRFAAEVDREVYRFVVETLDGGELPDPVLQPIRDRFGQGGAVELNIVVGYYTMLSLLLVSFAVPSPVPAPWG